MDILLYEWNTFGQKDLEDTLLRLGHKVDKIRYVFTDFEKDEAFEKKLSELFLIKRYDFVISFNFFQVISNICNSFCIKYIAWVWDSPLINLNSKTIYNPTNYIFIFDRYLYTQMKTELEADTVYYQPLAVNTDRLDKLALTQENWDKYRAEVSFVGSLYEKRSHYNEISGLPDYLKGYFDGIMRAQMNIHGYNFIKEMLTDEIMTELYQYINICPGDNYIGDVRDIFADRFLNTKITGMERQSLLNMLSEFVDVTIYTDSDCTDLIKVQNKGYIDYYTEMPKVFRCSSINLNITVRTIKSGIPLRVFDILGAGGFLITNYQEDLCEYFEIGKDLVIYENEEDLLNKVRYYLEHEEERKEIAKNGYNKVKQYHNYELRLKEILSIANGKQNINKQVENMPEDSSACLTEEVILRQRLASLIEMGRIEEAKAVYYYYTRRISDSQLSQELTDYDQMFKIYSYELQRKQTTIFELFSNLDQAWSCYDSLRHYITGLETGRDEEKRFIRYVKESRISYTPIEFIIVEYASDKVRLLNRVAWMFLQADQNELVLPFLSLANELRPEDDETLYHLAFILDRLGEYKLAYEYIDRISIALPETLELMEKLLQKITSSDIP
jgi:spore maturation protein CgeB